MATNVGSGTGNSLAQQQAAEHARQQAEEQARQQAQQQAQAQAQAQQKTQQQAQQKPAAQPSTTTATTATDNSTFQGNVATNKVALNAPAPTETGAVLHADQQYAKLAQQPGAKPIMSALGIRDGQSLHEFGQSVTTPTVAFGNVNNNDLKKALADADPKVAASVLQAIGQNAPEPANTILGDPKVASALGNAKNLPELFGALESGNWPQAINQATRDPEVLKAAGQAIIKDPNVQQALKTVGIKPEDAAQAGNTLPDLIAAGNAAVSGDWKTAAHQIGQAMQDAPELGAKLAGQFADALPEPVKGQLKALGLGPEDIKQLGKALPDVFDAASAAKNGDWLGAAKSIKQAATDAPQLTDKMFGAIAKDTGAQKFFQDKLGVDISKLPAPSKGIPNLVDLGTSLAAKPPDVAGTVSALQGLAQNTDPSAFKGALDKLGSALQNAPLPEGVRQNLGAFFNGVGQKLSGLAPGSQQAKDLLSTLANDKNLPQLADQLSKNDVNGALDTLAGDPKLLDAAGSAIISMPAVKDTLAKVGIDASKLPDAGKAFPAALNLSRAMSANPPDVGGSVKALQSLAQSVDPSAFSGVAGKLSQAFQSSSLPPAVKHNVTAFLDGVGTKLSGLAPGSQQAKDLLNTLATDQNLPQLATQLSKGDTAGALKTLANDPKLLDSAGDAIASMPAVKDTLGKVGIDVSKLPNASKVFPQALQLAQSISANPPDVAGSVKALQGLAQNLDPAAFAGVPGKIGEAFQNSTLPEDVKKNVSVFFNAVGNKLSGLAPGSQQAKDLLNTLATDQNLPQLADQLSKGQYGDAVKTLAGDPKLMDAAGDAIASMPAVRTALKSIGIDPSKLPNASKVIPSALDLQQALSKNPPDVAGSVKAMQGLAQNMDPAAFAGVPGKIADALKSSPLPEGVKQNLGAFFNGVGQKLSGLAPGSQQAKELLNTLATDQNLSQLADQLSKGQYSDALKTFTGDAKLMDATGNALTSMPVVQNALKNLGIDPSKLPDASKVLPQAVDLAQSLSANPPNVGQSVKDLQSLAQNLDPAAFTGVLGKMSDAFKNSPLPQNAKDNITSFLDGVGKKLSGLEPGSQQAKDLLNTLATDQNLPQLADQLSKGKFGDALNTLSQDPKLLDAAGDAVMSMPVVHNALTKLGIDPSKLPNASKIVPQAIDLAKSLAADPPDVKQSVSDLQSLAQNMDPAAFSGVLGKMKEAFNNSKLPDDVKQSVGQFFDGLNQKLSGFAPGSQQAKDFLNTLATDKNIPQLADQISKGDWAGALKTFTGDAQLMNTSADLITSMPAVQKFAQDKLGIDISKLPNASEVLPKVAELAGNVTANPPQWGKAAQNLFQIAGSMDPAAFKGLYDKVSAKLPEGVRNFLDAASKNPGFQDAVKTLANNPNFPTAVDQMAKGDWGNALKTIGGDAQLMGVVGEGLTQIPQVKDFLKSNLGLSDAQIGKLGSDVVPELAQAVTSANNPGEAAKHLLAAAGKLPADVAQQMFDAAATKLKLPEGAKSFVDNLFKNPGAQALFGNPNLGTAINQLIDGKPADALKTITSDPQILNAAGQAIVNVPQVKQFLQDKLGVDVSTLPNISDVLPHLEGVANALGSNPPDYGKALSELGQTALAAPDTTEQIVSHFASKLPDGLAKSLLTDKTVMDGVLKDPNIQQAMGNLLSGDGAKRMDGLKTLLSNDQFRNAALGDIANDPGIKLDLSKFGLTPQDVIDAGAAAPHVLDAVQKFQGGDVQGGVLALGDAVKAAPGLMDKIGNKIWQQLPKPLQNGLSKLGLDENSFKETAAALPDILGAANKIGSGDWQGALKDLGSASEKAPDVVAKLINAAASNIPDDPKLHLLKATLTDPKFIADLAGNKDLHDAFSKILSGDLPGGIKELANNTQVLTDLGNVLLKDQKAADALGKIGITSPADVAQLGASLGDALQLSQDLTEGHYEKALTDAGSLFTDIPNGMKAKVLDSIAKTLHLPPGLGDFLVQGGEALTDPAIRGQIGKAIQAFKDGNPGAFVQSLAETGRRIATKYPGVVTGFLDMMGKLPGAVGRFFSNHDLNDALAQSGSVGHAFDAIEKIARGDIPGALNEMASAAGALLGYGKHYSADIGWGPFSKHIDAPVGDKGLKAFGELFGQFVDALPNSVKTKILTEVAKLTAKAGASIIPGGSLLGLFGDVPDLVGQIQKNPKDPLGLAIDGAKVGLDIAGVIPGAGAVTGPLNTALGVISFVRDAKGLIDNIEAFKNEFAFGG